MKLEKLNELLLKPEDEVHDFKSEWYTKYNRSEMIKDIFSFINTNHHDDCYLIIGVDDNHKIVGIENDENRLNTQKITDLLKHLDFANSKRPKLIVTPFEIDEHVIDVITIKNTDDVPVYLKTKKQFNQCNKPIYPGQIFARENDTNTSINETADDYLVEALWKKRFKMNVPIKEKYKNKLKDYDNWEYDEIEGKCYFRYNLDPDYIMLLEPIEDASIKVESYSLSQFKKTISWYKLILKFKEVLIENITVVFLDGARFLTVTPNVGSIEFIPVNGNFSYQYMIIDSIEFIVEWFLFKSNEIITPNEYQMDSFLSNVVLFKNYNEMKQINRRLKNNISEVKSNIKVSKEEISELKDSLKYQLPKGDDELEDENLKYMCEQIKTSRFIKKYMKTLNK